MMGNNSSFKNNANDDIMNAACIHK